MFVLIWLQRRKQIWKILVNKLSAHYPQLSVLSHMIHSFTADWLCSFGSKESNRQLYQSQGCWKRKLHSVILCPLCSDWQTVWQTQGLLEELVHVPRKQKDRWKGHLNIFQFIDRLIKGLQDRSSKWPQLMVTYLKASTLNCNPSHYSDIQMQVTQTTVINQTLFYSLDGLLPQQNERFSLLLKNQNKSLQIVTTGKQFGPLQSKLT